MPFTLPNLPYAYDSLEPYFDMETMKVHHDKHHQTYVDKLNAALAGSDSLQTKTIEDMLTGLKSIDPKIQTAVRNHGGGHYNHSLFWTSLTPNKDLTPPKTLSEALTKAFGPFETFKQKFTEVAAGHFGSGWAWISLDKNHDLQMYSLPNQDSPLSQGDIPLLGLDVWEHAYYLKYQNRRPEYIDAFWHLVNWPEIESRYLNAVK